jgi:hypothetical protein
MAHSGEPMLYGEETFERNPTIEGGYRPDGGTRGRWNVGTLGTLERGGRWHVGNVGTLGGRWNAGTLRMLGGDVGMLGGCDVWHAAG